MVQEIDALKTAHREAGKRVQMVTSDQWDIVTPCDDWTVRQLVLHMVAGCMMSVAMLSGTAWDRSVADTFDRDGPAVVAAWEREATAEEAAFSEPGALDRTVDHPAIGEISARQFIGMRTADALLHAWDLARAISGDETLDGELVARVWAAMEPMGSFIGTTGYFGQGPSGDVDEAAPLQTRLLDLSGRRP